MLSPKIMKLRPKNARSNHSDRQNKQKWYGSLSRLFFFSSISNVIFHFMPTQKFCIIWRHIVEFEVSCLISFWKLKHILNVVLRSGFILFRYFHLLRPLNFSTQSSSFATAKKSFHVLLQLRFPVCVFFFVRPVNLTDIQYLNAILHTFAGNQTKKKRRKTCICKLMCTFLFVSLHFINWHLMPILVNTCHLLW